MFNRILVCIDGSPHSHEALRQAIDLAGRGNGGLDLLSVAPDAFNWVTGTPMLSGTDLKRLQADLDEGAQKLLNDALEELPEDITARTMLKRGDAATVILATLESGDYDLVVIGSRGMGNIRALLLGSVSRRVAHESHVPVLIIHAEHETAKPSGLATGNPVHQTLCAQYMPIYDCSDEITVEVNADLETTWRSLMETDLIEVGREHRRAGAQNMVRAVPELLTDLVHGKLPAAPPEHLRLKEIAEMDVGGGSWVLLGERQDDEIALGLIGKFWQPAVEYASVPLESYAAFAEPGFVKTIYAFKVNRLAGERTSLVATMRSQGTDDHARKRFRRYWSFGAGSGAHVLVSGMLELVQERAEQSPVAPRGEAEHSIV